MKITDYIFEFVSNQNTVNADEWFVVVMDTAFGVGYLSEPGHVLTELNDAITPEVTDAFVYLDVKKATEEGQALYDKFRAVNGWYVYRVVAEDKRSLIRC